MSQQAGIEAQCTSTPLEAVTVAAHQSAHLHLGWPLHKQCVMTQILSGSIHDLVRDNSCLVIAEGVRCNCSDATLSYGIHAQCSCRADHACTILSTVSLDGPSHLLQRPVEAWCHVTGSRHSMLACADMYRRCQRHGSCSLCNHIVISLYNKSFNSHQSWSAAMSMACVIRLTAM